MWRSRQARRFAPRTSSPPPISHTTDASSPNFISFLRIIKKTTPRFSLAGQFFHELNFPIWTRKGLNGLGLHVYPVRTFSPAGYDVPVPAVARAIEAGLRDVSDARLARDLRGEKYGEIRRRAWFHCLDEPPCGVERAERIVEAATAARGAGDGDGGGVCPGEGKRGGLRRRRRDSVVVQPSIPSSALSAGTLEALVPALSAAEAGRALEIGGPTSWLQDLYTPELSIDNVIRDVSDGYAARGGGLAGEAPKTEFPYVINGVGKGTTYVRDGSNLHGLRDGSYDLVLSSHNLEHFLDPLAALFEWNRVLRPGGYFLLILPWPAGTYDRKRKADDITGVIKRHTDPSRERLIEKPLKAMLEVRRCEERSDELKSRVYGDLTSNADTSVRNVAAADSIAVSNVINASSFATRFNIRS